MSEKLGFIPITEVSEHTDSIRIGELGLPVGIDLERIELNIPRVIRIARWGDIGHLRIEGYKGETTERDFGIGGVSSDGTGAITGSATIARSK